MNRLKSNFIRVKNYIVIGHMIKGMKITDVVFQVSYDGEKIIAGEHYGKYSNCIALILNNSKALFLGDFNAEDHLAIDEKTFAGDEIMAKGSQNGVWYLYSGDHNSKEQDREVLRKHLIGMEIDKLSRYPLDCFSMILTDINRKHHELYSNRLWWDRILLKELEYYAR